MKKEQLIERINKAEEKISKKEALIEKRLKSIEKKYQVLRKNGVEDPENHIAWDFADLRDTDHDRWEEIYWTYCDVSQYQDSIKNAREAIEQTNKAISKYKEQLAKEEDNQNIHEELPEKLKVLEAELITRWDEQMINTRNRLKEEYKSMGYRDFMQKYSRKEREFAESTDEQIHKANAESANRLVLDLYRRVKEFTGEITDWSGIYAEYGNSGIVLNGFVKGKEGWAEVESVNAGGYNIQRQHIRVLVKGA